MPDGVDPPQSQQDLVPTGGGLVHHFGMKKEVPSIGLRASVEQYRARPHSNAGIPGIVGI
jgi:hypothetical protein